MIVLLCQKRYQPAVDGTQCQLSFLGQPGCFRNILQNPCYFGSREIGGKIQTGVASYPLCQMVALFAQLCGPGALPNNGIADTFAGFPVPCHSGLPLIGDTHCSNVRLVDTGFLHHIPANRQCVCADLHGIMADPALVIYDLAMGPVCSAHQDALFMSLTLVLL